jgi:N-acetylated-alpha-linked acidic dipeptidase
LPHRDWFKHLLYAPGFYTGYGVKTVPGVREAIEQGQYADVDREVARAAAAITRLVALLDSASAEVEGGR